MKFQKVKTKGKSRVLRFNALIALLALMTMLALDHNPDLKHYITTDVCLGFIIIFAGINFVMRLDTKHYLASPLEQQILFPDSYIESEKASKRPPERS